MFGLPPSTGSAVAPPAVAKDNENSPEGMTGITGGDTARARGEDRRWSNDDITGVVLVVTLLIFIIFVSRDCSMSWNCACFVAFAFAFGFGFVGEGGDFCCCL